MPETETNRGSRVVDGVRVDPRLTLLAGAACVGLAAIFVKLADVSPSTATLFRGGLALLLLAPWVVREWRHGGPPAITTILLYLLGGLFLGTDLALWSQGILQAGAGISTLALNIQIIVLPLLGWLFYRERVSLGFIAAVPVVLVGVALVGGILGGHDDGGILLGGVVLSILAGLAYGAYLFLLSRYQQTGQRATQLFFSAGTAAVVGAAVGSIWGPPDLVPGWRAFGWLLALAVVGQIFGWFLIGVSLPRLKPSVGASVLLLQPVIAVGLGAVLFSETLSLFQLFGAAIVIAAVWVLSVRRNQ